MATPPVFSAGAVLTAAQMNAVGLWLVKTQTVGTGVSTQNVTSCFTSDFDVYRIVWANITATATANAMFYKLLVGTTATTAGFYGNTAYIANGAAAGFSNANLSNTSYAECGNLTTTYKNAGYFDLHQPNLATGTYSSFSLADDNFWRMGAHTLRNSTQYDGIQLFPGAGTLTGGTISVYGYRK